VCVCVCVCVCARARVFMYIYTYIYCLDMGWTFWVRILARSVIGCGVFQVSRHTNTGGLFRWEETRDIKMAVHFVELGQRIREALHAWVICLSFTSALGDIVNSRLL
jgi:hypothetical protein